jgi:hypothetical protein
MQLWETLPGVMIEAEFHAVWIDAAGNRRDVTPKESGAKHIWFLPDPKLVYDVGRSHNVRVALRGRSPRPRVHRVRRKFYEATNRGALADFHGDLKLTPEMRRLMERRLQLQLQIQQKYYAS